jgi:gamma-polyglutamate biosynthesis protein CapA
VNIFKNKSFYWLIFFWLVFFLILWGTNFIGSYFLTKPHDQRESGRMVSLEKSTPTIKILFGGDLMFDRHIRFFADKEGSYDFILADLKNLFFDYDLVVANLEGPITDNNSVSIGTVPGTPKNFIFTFDPQVAKTLFDNNIRLVNLGNNHILNFGQSGLDSTRRYLSEAKVDYFGFAGDDQDRTLIQKIDGVSLGFVNYNQFIEGGLAAAEEDIDSLAGTVDWLILYAHWGNEYQSQAGAAIRELAKNFVDRGADLIIGSHSHVVGVKETNRDRTIYYSLGNFVFDQYFSSEVMTGLLVGVEIDVETKKIINIQEWSIKMTPDGRTIFDF